MPQTLITLEVSVPAPKVLATHVRLIKKDNKQEYYLDIMSGPADSVQVETVSGVHQSMRFPRWRQPIASDEVKAILNSLIDVSCSLTPILPKDNINIGNIYFLRFENDANKISLQWHENLPNEWAGVSFAIEKLLAIAESSAPPLLRNARESHEDRR